MATNAKSGAVFREGKLLRIGREFVSFGRNMVIPTDAGFALQHRVFVNDPWAMIAEGIHRGLPKGRTREIAHSFRNQAEEYFVAATTGRELSVRPVLLYYSFLNLAKAYALSRGSTKLLGRSYHGLTPIAKPGAVTGSFIKLDPSSPKRPSVFEDLTQYLGGDPKALRPELRVGYLLPQILPGHRLWCYAADKAERFLPIESVWVNHSSDAKKVWLNIFLRKSDVEQLEVSPEQMLRQADLLNQFEIAEFDSEELLCLQQRSPETYETNPKESLFRIGINTRNKIWETVKIVSPYRKPYVYCCPASERSSRLPQLLSVYLLMFFLGSVTRYFPLHFDGLLDSRYGPLFETFIYESPMQFLYLMASEILGREVSKPAII